MTEGSRSTERTDGTGFISGQTRLAAVIGDPVRHSRSPLIHNAAFAALGLDWVYLAFPVAAGNADRALDAMRTLSIDGLSVTMPHKQQVAESVDEATAETRALGACNCVVRDGDKLVGHNTDGAGFVAAVEAETGRGLGGTSVGVIGAGGAARAIVFALGQAGASDVVVVNRTTSAGQSAAELTPVARVGGHADLEEVDVVINATSVGMVGGPDPTGMPHEPALIRAGQIVADIVYQPLETAWMAAARQQGATVVGGLGMLVHQAALAFELWTGRRPPIDVMTQAVSGELG